LQASQYRREIGRGSFGRDFGMPVAAFARFGCTLYRRGRRISVVLFHDGLLNER
jgi:hypothetical protein